MAGLNIRAKWELLTVLVPEPMNVNDSMRPPSEPNAQTNPKLFFEETSDCIQFTGTLDKMGYIRMLGGRTKRGSCCKQGRVELLMF